VRGRVARKGLINVYKILDGNAEDKRQRGRLGIDETIILNQSLKELRVRV
jgi:hypothetical protein